MHLRSLEEAELLFADLEQLAAAEPRARSVRPKPEAFS
jgi:hypothetical protein